MVTPRGVIIYTTETIQTHDRGASKTLVMCFPLNTKLTYGWEDDITKSVVVDVELKRAWSESQYKSDRVGNAWRIKKAEAINGFAITPKVPLWLNKPAVGETITVNEERACTVLRMFQLAAEGLGAGRIIKALLKEGHQPFNEKWNPE
jgi:hypothetical protein